ncbi:VOC family protein [Erwiniaceae bacterium BAC15a-03b]|uniref:VOC family protein n=1 Tax=Winslowiella arboricola TaxID=2978220 RepID=A0A9J6PR98_9GAMM|nr:VOC family protein [Winslowiella arboricola]MCU5774462.1 VOC family protein [Winslowiella arboricola]MCU5778128.1 VOC family protein [Winslowiella arboricola]
MVIPVPAPELDHVVITVADQLDSASVLYQRLGFQLTPRGHHSLGSSNHLAVFKHNYLELLGLEKGRAHLRPDLQHSVPGLNALVWKTDDADAVYQHLQRQDLDGDAPAAFYRPVTLPDGNQQEARFRTVSLRPELVVNGRSFFCQHLTPQSVWQPAWQQHPNAVSNISEFVIVAQDPARVAQVYSQLFGSNRIVACLDGAFVLRAGAATVRFAAASYVENRFGALPADYQGEARMVAISLQSDDLAKTRASLLHGEVPWREQQDALVVDAANAFNLTLRFHR